MASKCPYDYKALPELTTSVSNYNTGKEDIRPIRERLIGFYPNPNKCTCSANCRYAKDYIYCCCDFCFVKHDSQRFCDALIAGEKILVSCKESFGDERLYRYITNYGRMIGFVMSWSPTPVYTNSFLVHNNTWISPENITKLGTYTKVEHVDIALPLIIEVEKLKTQLRNSAGGLETNDSLTLNSLRSVLRTTA
jgi:hypothetical protein